MNIVLIPCWRRADFLAITLERIQIAYQAESHFYIFLVDQYPDPDIYLVIESFLLPHEIRQAPSKPVAGNSYNVLSALRSVLSHRYYTTSDIVYLIEEDIWISRGFFVFSSLAHQTLGAACVSAVRNHHDSRNLDNSADTVYYHHRYQSLGVSFNHMVLATITEHHCPAYYRDQWSYCRQIKATPRQFIEQDGLIDCVLSANNIETLYASFPRAFHAGFVGYNRPGSSLAGSLDERISQLRQLSEEEMNLRATAYRDIRTTVFQGQEPSILKIVKPEPLTSHLRTLEGEYVTLTCHGGLSYSGHINSSSRAPTSPGYFVKGLSGLTLWIPLSEIDMLNPQIDLPLDSPLTVQPAAVWHLIRHLNISLLLDANSGNERYGLSMRLAGYTGEIISFEPQSNMAQQMADRVSHDGDWLVENFGLDSQRQKRFIYVEHECDVGSYFMPTDVSKRYRFSPGTTAQEECETMSLDEYLEPFESNGRNLWLRIDSRGAEHSIFEGAIKTLNVIAVISIVTAPLALFDGQMIASEVITFLNEKGFFLLNSSNLAYDPATGFTSQLDLLFIRNCFKNVMSAVFPNSVID